jgi:hypothetical protein
MLGLTSSTNVFTIVQLLTRLQMKQTMVVTIAQNWMQIVQLVPTLTGVVKSVQADLNLLLEVVHLYLLQNYAFQYAKVMNTSD